MFEWRHVFRRTQRSRPVNILQVKSSLFAANGQSSRLADEFIALQRARDPETRVVARDLAAEPVPHLTAERFQAFLAKPDARTAEQQAIVAYSDALIDE